MKLHILSDIHIEFSPFHIPATDADVIILAGDIGIGIDGVAWAIEQDIGKPVIYVPGNHEYYYHDISLIEQLKAQASEPVVVMDNDERIINGVRFLGSTLWTDFALYGHTERYFVARHARKNMSDFSLIKNGSRTFSPDDSIELHYHSRHRLMRKLDEPFDGKTVVVTHHVPSPRSIAPRFQGDLLTPAFTTDLEYLMGGGRVCLWIHGHTHDVFDYTVSGSRVVCNPRGYAPYENGNGFNPGLVVEI